MVIYGYSGFMVAQYLELLSANDRECFLLTVYCGRTSNSGVALQMCLFLTLEHKGSQFTRKICVNKLSCVGFCVSGLVRRPTVLGFIAGQAVCCMLFYYCCGFLLPI